MSAGECRSVSTLQHLLWANISCSRSSSRIQRFGFLVMGWQTRSEALQCLFIGGYTPGTSPWKMGIRTGAQTPETTKVLWLPLPSPSWAICLQRIKPKPKVPSAEAGSSLLAVTDCDGHSPVFLCPGQPSWGRTGTSAYCAQE